MSAPPGFGPIDTIRYSSRELKLLSISCKDEPCPEELQCYFHLKANRDLDGWKIRPAKQKKQDRKEWRTDIGQKLDGKTDKRRERGTPNQANCVRLENLKKIDLPLDLKNGKQDNTPHRAVSHGRLGSACKATGGWDDVEAGEDWVGASSESRIAPGARISAADKKKQFELERQEILSQRSGETPANSHSLHLAQQAAGVEGSYHTEADSLMAELQAEAGQLVSSPLIVLANEPTSISNWASTSLEIPSSSIWSPTQNTSGSSADFFSADFFSSATPLVSGVVLSETEDINSKGTTRLKSWLSALSGEDDEKGAGVDSTVSSASQEKPKASRMHFVPESPPSARMPNAAQDIADLSLPSAVSHLPNEIAVTSPQKGMKISLNSLFSMAGRSPNTPRTDDLDVVMAADVLGKLGFSGVSSPSRDDLNAQPNPPVSSIAASLGPQSPVVSQPPNSPFTFPIHHFAPPGTTPVSSRLPDGGLSTPPAKTGNNSQPRSGSKGVNVSASSRLLIQQQKNKRQQLEKQQETYSVSTSQTLGVAIKFGDASEKSTGVNGSREIRTEAHRSSDDICRIPASKQYVDATGQTQDKFDHKTGKAKALGADSMTSSVPSPVINVGDMQKINVNSLFARAASMKPAV